MFWSKKKSIVDKYSQFVVATEFAEDKMLSMSFPHLDMLQSVNTKHKKILNNDL